MTIRTHYPTGTPIVDLLYDLIVDAGLMVDREWLAAHVREALGDEDTLRCGYLAMGSSLVQANNMLAALGLPRMTVEQPMRKDMAVSIDIPPQPMSADGDAMRKVLDEPWQLRWSELAKSRKAKPGKYATNQDVIDHYQAIADDPARTESDRAHARDFVERSVPSDAPTPRAIAESAWAKATDPNLTDEQRVPMFDMLATMVMPSAEALAKARDQLRRQPLMIDGSSPAVEYLPDARERFAARPTITGDDLPHAEVLTPYLDRFLATLESAYRTGAGAILMLATDDKAPREPLDLRRAVIPPAFAIVPAGQRTAIHPSRLWTLSPIDELDTGAARSVIADSIHWALTAMFAAQDGPTHGRIPASWESHWLSE